MKKFALAGNPNSGKTSVFNELTGSSQYVGNWPGVTVEKKEGRYKKNKDVMLQDLPGIYSLSPYSPEEKVARQYLLNDTYNGIINIVDGTNLERNLYLTTQLLEIGQPLTLAVNMMDILKKTGKKINLDKLSYALNIPVVGISALKKTGLNELMRLVENGTTVVDDTISSTPIYDPRLESALNEIKLVLGKRLPQTSQRFWLIKIFGRKWSSIPLQT